MWSLYSCPRCRGDVFIDEEQGKFYEKCLQCGYERELETVAIRRKNSEPAQSFKEL